MDGKKLMNLYKLNSTAPTITFFYSWDQFSFQIQWSKYHWKNEVNVFVLGCPLAQKSLKAQGRTQQNDEPHKIHVDHGCACGGGETHLSAVTGACGSLIIPVLEGTVTSCRAYFRFLIRWKLPRHSRPSLDISNFTGLLSAYE